MSPAGVLERGEDVLIYPDRRRLATVAIIGVALALLSLLLAVFREVFRVAPVEWVVLVVGAPVFACWSLVVLRRVLRPQPVLVISRAGIVVDWFFSSGSIRWPNVRRVFIYRFMRQRFLGVAPVSLETLLANRSPALRWLLRINYAPCRTPFSIPERFLPMSLEELLAIIDRYRPR